MTTVNLQVGGMSCEMCVGHVTRALLGVEGVTSAKVDLASGSAVVLANLETVKIDQLIEAVTEEGYDAKVVA